METVSRLLLVLNTLWAMTGYAAPLLDAKDTWNRNILASVIKTTCSSDGQCWGWLPLSDTHDGNIISRENDGTSRYTFVLSFLFLIIVCVGDIHNIRI